MEITLWDLVKCYTWLEKRYCLGPSMILALYFLLLFKKKKVREGVASTIPPSCFHHHVPFAFLIMLQMCLMAEQFLCTERGAPAGIREACLCEPSWKKKKMWEGKEGRKGGRECGRLGKTGKTGEISEQRPSQQGSFRLCACEVARWQTRPRSRSPLDLQTKPH